MREFTSISSTKRHLCQSLRIVWTTLCSALKWCSERELDMVLHSRLTSLVFKSTPENSTIISKLPLRIKTMKEQLAQILALWTLTSWLRGHKLESLINITLSLDNPGVSLRKILILRFSSWRSLKMSKESVLPSEENISKINKKSVKSQFTRRTSTTTTSLS